MGNGSNTSVVGLQSFNNALYCFGTHLIMAALTAMILPCILVFFFSQRIFLPRACPSAASRANSPDSPIL
jgi:ABC-type glycerol-3-phosphate transport system permease component